MNILDAFYRTVHDAVGGCEALAVRLGMSAQILRNKANPNNPANRVLLEDVDQVMGITGDIRVLHALAANHGHVCVRTDPAASASDLAVLELVVQVMTGNGDVGAEVNRTLADGRVERHEIEAVEAAVYRTNQAMQQLVERLKGMAEK
ncbi:phage regulatory protein CII [Pseudoduganella lurida]|uniref:Phage regulatory protein CII n=1 Tax=Pseudoduganella lurida TaxID=1036180 RepID=A0A562R7Z6_9BURK|nr:phage regulatory CII family protein [Pseudoduganella lurida]TWI65187.1 phage regulatory protein CII [Pseudoduganella lurida]